MSVLGNAIVAAGATVGVVTVAAVATGYQVHLTPEMTQLIIYKGFGAMAVGLIVAGAWVGRTARTMRAQDGRDDEVEARTSETSNPEIEQAEPLALRPEVPSLPGQSFPDHRAFESEKKERTFGLDQ